ncbi:MAG TPA: recombinase family protein [Steroidobacter sp.]|nr:recombinase family protein [Steroidobacter sp.]
MPVVNYVKPDSGRCIKFQPDYADRGDCIVLKGSWTKGGRPRTVPIITPEQRAALDAAHGVAGSGSLIPAQKTYIQQRQTYDGQCRVSDKKQRNDGDGLQSQEHRCRDYAAARGYDEAVFHDDVSGGGDFMQRPGMVAMLQFMKAQAHDGYVVIFDDLKRFARDSIFHLKLRQKLAAYW